MSVSNNAGSDQRLPPTQNELLCFICQKCKIMTVDDIAKICSDFYKEDEVFAARALLEQALSYRLPRREGPNKCRMTTDDLIKTCLDRNKTLPLYYAADLGRLPAVDSNHGDMSAILLEPQYLREQVRQLRNLKSKVDEIAKSLANREDGYRENFPPLSSTAVLK